MFILLKPVAWIGRVIVDGIASIGEVICILLLTIIYAVFKSCYILYL